MRSTRRVQPARPSGRSALWRRRSFEVITSNVVAGHAPGPEPPAVWAPHLRQLVDASRAPVEGPAWWTPAHAYFGNVETRIDAPSYRWDGMRRLAPSDRPLVFFQLTLAGWGQFERYGKPPQRLPPGHAFFAVVPSRHRYYLPEASPGWTFCWIGIYHPYLLRRIARQVAATGPVVQVTPGAPLAVRMMRLVRGAFEKDFRDRQEVELALFDFLFAYERLAQELSDPEGERERLLGSLRARVLATPRRPPSVDEVAAEHGMSRSHFSHHFRRCAGLTPARFMTEVRIQEAARGLLATSRPLKEIAGEWGFANANHFGKVFRRFLHASPAAYRRSLR
ncbi:MAG TPA: AraC family transcriptional regulator [Polyangia bacterium]|nr:AraC family transcriptional regulator [Polyangia bacterium]